MENFTQSMTCQNLMRAFAGESQARNRYTFAASAAMKQHNYLVAQTFLYTANQEKEHAELFWQLLEDASGGTVRVEGGYPVQTTEDIAVLLKDSVHNETEEAEDAYPAFAKVAEEEGFARAAEIFRRIAEVERTHAERFSRFEEMLNAGKLFKADSETGWICLNCGHIHYGAEVPGKCPVCGHERGWFIREDLTPFRK